MRHTTIRQGSARRTLRLYLPSLLEGSFERAFGHSKPVYLGTAKPIIEWAPGEPRPPLTEHEVAQLNEWLRVQQERRP